MMKNKKYNFKIKKKKLILASKKVVEFEYPIAEVIEISHIFVVRLDVPTKIVYNENVFGVDLDGKILWRIEPRKYIYKESPYVEMTKIENGVRIFNWDCVVSDIDPQNGTVFNQYFGK